MFGRRRMLIVLTAQAARLPGVNARLNAIAAEQDAADAVEPIAEAS
jgi:hypothetical protein